MPQRLYHQGKRHLYPLNRRLGGPQGRSECFAEEKNLVPLLGFEPGNHLSHSLVTILTTLDPISIKWYFQFTTSSFIAVINFYTSFCPQQNAWKTDLNFIWIGNFWFQEKLSSLTVHPFISNGIFISVYILEDSFQISMLFNQIHGPFGTNTFNAVTVVATQQNAQVNEL